MITCRVGECLRYACDQPATPIDGATYAPYIQLVFAGGQKITVGNKSSPATNLAAIQSMTYGYTSGGTGWGCELEIIDNGGVMYRKIVRVMNKTLALVKEDRTSVRVDFGWIITDCNGVSTLKSCKTMTGYEIQGLVLNVDTAFEGGNVRIKMSIKAPQARMYETSHAGSIAGEDQKVTLKEALRKLFTEKEPRYDGVEFRDKNGGTDFQFKSSDGGGDGPKCTWPLDQESTYTTARKWLSSMTTKNDLGIALIYDNRRNFMVIQEDTTDRSKLCDNNLGTYVVNGGNCSPVISFTPQLQWIVGTGSGAGGSAGGAASGDNSKQSEPDLDVQKSGNQIQVAVQQHEWQFRNPDDMPNKAIDGFNKNMDASKGVGENLAPTSFNAELKIHGNPTFSDPLFMLGKTVSIIFINPFYLGEGCIWLQTSSCNSVLSHKQYQIKGCCHQIQNGSYTTTLSLTLPAPNATENFDAPLGGIGGTENFVDGEDGKGKSLPLDGNQNG